MSKDSSFGSAISSLGSEGGWVGGGEGGCGEWGSGEGGGGWMGVGVGWVGGGWVGVGWVGDGEGGRLGRREEGSGWRVSNHSLCFF